MAKRNLPHLNLQIACFCAAIGPILLSLINLLCTFMITYAVTAVRCQNMVKPLLFTGDQLINFMQPVLSVLALNQRENQPGIINIPQSLSKRADGH